MSKNKKVTPVRFITIIICLLLRSDGHYETPVNAGLNQSYSVCMTLPGGDRK